MADPIRSNSTAVAADIFSEFLEVAIHCILYNRELYPAGVFEKRKKYNVPTQMCLHPEVTQYVAKVIEDVKVMVESGQVSLVSMVMLDVKQKPQERFVFQLENSEEAGNSRKDQFLFQLQESLRAFLLKLNLCDALLKPLPQDCTWTIHVHTKESTADSLLGTGKDFSWVEADETQTILENPTLVPLKMMNSDILRMQLYVEESSKKEGKG